MSIKCGQYVLALRCFSFASHIVLIVEFSDVFIIFCRRFYSFALEKMWMKFMSAVKLIRQPKRWHVYSLKPHRKSQVKQINESIENKYNSNPRMLKSLNVSIIIFSHSLRNARNWNVPKCSQAEKLKHEIVNADKYLAHREEENISPHFTFAGTHTQFDMWNWLWQCIWHRYIRREYRRI